MYYSRDYCGIVCNYIYFLILGSRGRSNSSMAAQDPNTSDDDRITHDLSSKLLSRSRSSLHEDQTSRAHSTQRYEGLSSSNRNNEVSISNNQSDNIYLPKDYKPEFLLDTLEKKSNFISKNFYQNYKDCLENFSKQEYHNSSIQNAFTNIMFSENYEQRYDQHNFHVQKNIRSTNNVLSRNYKDVISSRRVKELKVLGCLIVEIFMAKYLRPVGSTNIKVGLEDRIKYCKSILNSYDIPQCISYIVNLLLQPENEEYSAVTDMGLPSPSAHLLLEPLMHCTIPFSKHFPQLYELIHNLKDFKNVTVELNILYHFDCNGQMCSEYENIEKTKIVFAQNIAECKVKMCAKQLEVLFFDINTDTDNEIVNIILNHIKDLIEDPPTSVLTAWYLFEPISRVLGPKKASKHLLEPILKLYENESLDTNLPFLNKIAKLYHHSFLLCLIARLGLKVFLENFVVPLVEAVGGYKDYELVDFVLHNHSERVVKRSSHLRTIESEQMDISNESACSDRNKILLDDNYVIAEEICEADEEKNNEDQMKFLMDHLDLNESSEQTAIDDSLDVNLENTEKCSGDFIFHFEDENVESEGGKYEKPKK